MSLFEEFIVKTVGSILGIFWVLAHFRLLFPSKFTEAKSQSGRPHQKAPDETHGQSPTLPLTRLLHTLPNGAKIGPAGVKELMESAATLAYYDRFQIFGRVFFGQCECCGFAIRDTIGCPRCRTTGNRQ